MHAAPLSEDEMTSDLEQQASGHCDLVDPVRQLLSSVTSSLQNNPPTSQCVIEEALAQLESTDENFHSYELVRSLHSQLDAVIDPLVESRIEKRVLEGDGHKVVPHITEEVLASSEYDQLCHSFLSELRSAMDEILASETTPVTYRLDVGQMLHSSSGSSATQYFNLEDSTGSDLSGLHPTGLMFMSHDQLQTIADALQPSQALHVRLEAIRHLLQFPSGDLVTPENWSLLKDPIREALNDQDDSLSDLCLKFHYRTFSAHTANTTRVAYNSLAEHLTEYCQSQEGGVVTLSMGVDPSDDRCVRLLAKFRLLNYFQLDVPSYWLRYNERVVEELVGCTFAILSLSYLNPTLLGPAHFIALVDPKAVWFTKWMHGQYSRTFVLDLLKNRPIILQGVLSQVMKFGGGPSHQRGSATPSPDFYNEKTLEFIHFVHSLCLLERVLLYQGGRDLFPVTTPENGELVGVADLLVRLLRLLYRISVGVATSKRDNERTFDPILIIVHLFNEIASGNAQCRQLLCNDGFISELIAPLKVSMTTNECPSVSEEVMVLIADVVAILASTDQGRTQLLSGSEDGVSNKSSTLHTIAQFVIHSLSSHTSTPHISPEVTSAWLFVCRQLYNTSEGLACLEPYQLHLHIARAHSELQDGTRAASGGGLFQTDTQTFSLEESLIDNLLNFAGTPKGVLLLQQSGLMGKCTQYMHHRYKLKLQVSKYEKFGYGCMVTLLASTPAGIVELNNCGFITMLVQELWRILDGGEEDYRLTAPRTHPLDPIDRVSHKAVINLLNVFSSYSALYEILNKTTPTTSQSLSMTTLFDLLDRLVLVDSEPKRSLLFNYQESHIFGLRILSTLVTCLDSYLYLDAQFNISEALLSLQGDQQMNDFIIIDACSVERNRILVSCYFIGGPNERKLPPHYLTDVSEDYCWPLFSSFPPPSVYQAPPTYNPSYSTSNTDRELQGLLTDSSSLSSVDWLSHVRHAVCALVKQKKTLPSELIWQLLVKCVCVQGDMSEGSVFPVVSKPSGKTKLLTSTSQEKLSKIDELGVKMAVRYGQLLGVLPPSVTSTHQSGLVNVLSKTKRMLSSQQHSKRHLEIASMNGSYPGFDWFVSTIYLLARGSGESSWDFLKSFSSSLSSGYVWPARPHLSLLLPPELALSGVPPITSVIGHYVELILQSEVPLVSSAFRMSGYNPSQICQHWCSQCFWNFLDWNEIGLYLICCILLGVDYQVYFCVAVMKHLEAKILQHTQEHNLMVFLKEEALVGFRCSEWIDLMQSLENKFRPCVLKAMKNFT